MAVVGGARPPRRRARRRGVVLLLKNALQDVLPLIASARASSRSVAFAVLFILLLQYARGG